MMEECHKVGVSFEDANERDIEIAPSKWKESQ